MDEDEGEGEEVEVEVEEKVGADLLRIVPFHTYFE